MARESISGGLRFKVFQRDGFTCHYCGAHPPEVKLHVDHINPVSRGGTNRIDNLVTACAPCNLAKHDRLVMGPAVFAEFKRVSTLLEFAHFSSTLDQLEEIDFELSSPESVDVERYLDEFLRDEEEYA